MKRTLKGEDIFIYNDFIEGLVDNPDSVINYVEDKENPQEESFDLLFDASFKSIRGYKLLDYLFLNNASYGDPNYLISRLIEEDAFASYISSVIKRDDNFLKAFLYVYLRPGELQEKYKDKHILVHDLIEEGDHYLDYRVNALLVLLSENNDQEIVDQVKKSVEKMTRNDKEVKENSEEKIVEIIESINKEINKITKAKTYVNK